MKLVPRSSVAHMQREVYANGDVRLDVTGKYAVATY